MADIILPIALWCGSQVWKRSFFWIGCGVTVGGGCAYVYHLEKHPLTGRRRFFIQSALLSADLAKIEVNHFEEQVRVHGVLRFLERNRSWQRLTNI